MTVCQYMQSALHDLMKAATAAREHQQFTGRVECDTFADRDGVVIHGCAGSHDFGATLKVDPAFSLMTPTQRRAIEHAANSVVNHPATFPQNRDSATAGLERAIHEGNARLEVRLAAIEARLILLEGKDNG